MVSCMGSDERKFTVEIGGDEPRFWRAVQAIEVAALEAAQQHGHACAISVTIDHDTGSFTRGLVADAKATAERNGFTPENLWMTIYQGVTADVTPTEGVEPMFDPRYLAWIRANAAAALSRFPVVVIRGNEVEVNGVFTMLQNAVASALHVPAPLPGDDVATVAVPRPVWWRRWWTAATTHPMIVTVVGGLIVAGVLAWAGLD